MNIKSILINFYYVHCYGLYNELMNIVSKVPFVFDTDKTIDKILNDKCSVSRYGDGELKIIIDNYSIGFQEYDKTLATRLDSIINKELENHIVCIPNVFKSTCKFNNNARIFWNKFIKKYRYELLKKVNPNKKYYDTQVTRLYMDYKDKSNVGKRFEKFKLIWKDREVIIIEGVESRLGLGNNLFDSSKKIERILCPSRNAFDYYDEIFNVAKKQDKNKLILIALGPTATVLAYDLAKEGYQAIDIGHIDVEYEWFLKCAEKKISLENKYVNEAISSGTSSKKTKEVLDDAYLSQIIYKI